MLLAVAAANYQILQVSLNTAQMLGIEPQKLLNKPLQELLGDRQVEQIQRCLLEDFEEINPLAIAIEKEGQEVTFDAIVHQNGDVVIVELEDC